MDLTCLDEAATRISAYSSWESRWETFLKHRTYANTHHERPTGINARTQRWYTHRELRRCRSLFRALIQPRQLFTWLTGTNAPAPTITSALEGSPNKAVTDLPRAHRKMPEHHARRAVETLSNFPYRTPQAISELINETH